MRRSILVMLAFVLGHQAPAGQTRAAAQQQPPFRSGTQVVEVDVRVFDKDGHFVTDLKPEDFEIKEDGVAQSITALTLVGEPANPRTQPANPGPREPENPGTQPANPGTREPENPTTWVFLFDTFHLSHEGLSRTRRAVTQFIEERMHRGDLGGVIANGKIIGGRLTTDREELAKRLPSITMPGDAEKLDRDLRFEVPRFKDQYEAYLIAERGDPSATAQAVRRGCEDEPLMCPQMESLVMSKAQTVDGQLHDMARLTLGTIRALSRGLARIPGTKSIVFVSEGFMLWNVQSELRDAIGEANRAGAHVYAIDARGLSKGHSAGLLFATHPDRPEDAINFDELVDGPNSLAIDTGGLFIENQNDFGRALDTIQRDASTYYVVGYTPSNQNFDGRYRRIAVAVKRQGARVRARRGYLALDPVKLR